MAEDERIKSAIRAFMACRPIDRVACQDFGMQQEDLLQQQLEAAISAYLAGGVVMDGPTLFHIEFASNGFCPSCDGWTPQTELEHFMQCPVCDQMFDMRRLDQVAQHIHDGPEQSLPDRPQSMLPDPD